jgi:hypothetical protein
MDAGSFFRDNHLVASLSTVKLRLQSPDFAKRLHPPLAVFLLTTGCFDLTPALLVVSCEAVEERYSGFRVTDRPVVPRRFLASSDFQTSAACNAAFRESLKVSLNLVARCA